jgi:hypothetical protein
VLHLASKEATCLRLSSIAYFLWLVVLFDDDDDELMGFHIQNPFLWLLEEPVLAPAAIVVELLLPEHKR